MEAWREALQSLEKIRVASLHQYRYFKVKFYACFQVAHVHAETRITASLSLCFLMVRLCVHTSFTGVQGTQPWKRDGFHLQRRQLMACAGGVCTNVAEHGADPKRHMFPFSLPCVLLEPGCWQGGGSLDCSKLFRAAGVRAQPTPLVCPATGFPCCDWLLSLVLAEVCLAAWGPTPHSHRETSCAALTINTHSSYASQSSSLRIPFLDPVSFICQPSRRCSQLWLKEAASLSSLESGLELQTDIIVDWHTQCS